MAVYLKEFSTHTEYDAYINGSGAILPNVSTCTTEGHVHYSPLEPEPPIISQLICTYYIDEGNVESDISLIYGLDYAGYGIRSMEVDGVVLNNIVDTYRFETPGEHIVKFTLSDNNIIVDRMFESCYNLIKVSIPNSVTSIGDSAFGWCTSLTSITIPNSVTSIGNYAFIECYSLTSIDMPSSVTSIGSDAFNSTPWWDTYSADTSHQYGNVIYINNIAYKAVDTSIESAVIAEGTVAISDYAFGSCESLTSITIPNSVTSIGSNAFEGTPWWHTYSADTSHQYGNVIYINNIAYKAVDTSIESAVIAEGTVVISDYAFYDCASLTSITIPDSVTSIGSSAFTNCNSLTSCTIGSGVTSIGDFAFAWCSDLTNIVIPDSVTSIGGSAFTSCYSLTSIVIPSGVASIGASAFTDCTGLTSITIPNSVTSIGYGAFGSCSSLTSVNIPNSVTNIGNSAFWACSSLTSVNIPNSVTSIGTGAFSSCSSLTSVNIPNSITSIGWGIFEGCSNLTSIDIPSSVTSIDYYAFNGCSSLTSVTVNATTPPTLEYGVFDGNASGRKIYVPAASVEAYKAATNWSEYADDIEPIA